MDAVKSLLDEQNLGIRKALSEVCCYIYSLQFIMLLIKYMFLILLVFGPVTFMVVDCGDGFTLLLGRAICRVVCRISCTPLCFIRTQ